MEQSRISREEIRKIFLNTLKAPELTEDELKDVQKTKRQELETAFFDVFKARLAPAYYWFSEDSTFGNIWDSLDSELQENKREILSQFCNFGSDIEHILDALERMFSVDYDPSTPDINHRTWELFTLWLYSGKLPDVPPRILDMRLDLARTKLLRYVEKLVTVRMLEGRDLKRLKKSVKATKKRPLQRRKEVKYLYNEINTQGRSKHAIANLIHQKMKKKWQTPPSVKTITRDLEKLGLC